MADVAEQCKAAFEGDSVTHKNVALRRAYDEIGRLQTIIDSRPAINAALPESYVKWSQSIYEMETAHVLGRDS